MLLTRICFQIRVFDLSAYQRFHYLCGMSNTKEPRTDNRPDLNRWLPTSAKEVELRGWDYLDVVLFSGDAYIDHPSFGAAVIGRVLESMGLRVALVPQPNWRDDLRDFKKLGIPRLFFGVTAGNMDSMINHYTAGKRRRSDDAYTPDGKAGSRPDYACTVYSTILKELFPQVPVVIGGIEASLRRLTHYDYWSDTLKPSILIDSKADLLLYGMAEKSLKELTRRLQHGESFASITNLAQTAYVSPVKPAERGDWKTIELRSYEECRKDKLNYAHNFRIFEEESNKQYAARLVEPTQKQWIVVNPPYAEWSQSEIDAPYELPYTRLPHPRYDKKGAIPAYDMIKNSVNIHRGCFGGCSFCTISAHQGKFVQSRSQQSILHEVEVMASAPDFKGNLSDLGGPSANMYAMGGKNRDVCKKCRRASCIFPAVCNNLNTNHQPLLDLYEKVLGLKGVKRVFIGSGVRYDLIYHDKDPESAKSRRNYLHTLVTRHVSGRLKVAPEHTASGVLKLMRKPSFNLFHKLKADFDRINREAGLNQQLIPYFISSHPGSHLCDMAELAAETKHLNFKLEQVQDFTPTPMTLATCMYYTGVDPYTQEPVFTVKNKDDKQKQLMFLFWYKPEFRNQIIHELEKIGRQDLMQQLMGTGFTGKKPEKPMMGSNKAEAKNTRGSKSRITKPEVKNSGTRKGGKGKR